MPFFYDLLLLIIAFSAVSASAPLDSSASHNYAAAPQVAKFSSSVQKLLLYTAKPMEVHFAGNY